MFIAHGERIRKHSRKIFFVILIILIPGFIALFTTTSSTSRQREELPTVRGKPVNAAEYAQARLAFMAQHVINTGNEVPHTLEFQDRVTQEAVVRMLLLRKAQELGIRVTDNEVTQHIRSQPVFRNETGQFVPEAYEQFIRRLNGLGVSEAEFEAVMRDSVTLAQLESLVEAAAKVTPQEVELAYAPLHEKLAIDLVEFHAASNAAPVAVTDDEARAFFEKNKETFRIPKQVRVRWVFFSVAEAKKSVTVADTDIADFYERNKAQYTDTNNVAKPLDAVKEEIRDTLLKNRADRRAQDRATELTVKLVQEPNAPKPDFLKLCSEFGVAPQETEFFSLSDKVAGIEAGPQFNMAAFALTPEVPFSDPVPGKDGYYVLEYLAAKPSEIPSFEQAKEKVIDELKHEKTYEATIKQGRDALAQVKKLMADGKTFDQACAELKLSIESPPPFALSDEKSTLPERSQIQPAALGMTTNTVSEFLPTEDGGLFFYLKERKPPDPAEFEKAKADFTQQVLQRQRQAVFSSWISALIRSEQVNFGHLRSRERQVRPAETPEAAPEQPAPSQPAPAPAQAPANS